MPKPLMLSRSAGLYARFFVPTDLRAVVGTRYLVRSLGARRGDQARLVAAMMGMALCAAFDAMRKGIAVDVDELLKKVRNGEIQELILHDVKLPNGTRIAQAQLESPADAALFGDLMARAATDETSGTPGPKMPKRPKIDWDASESTTGVLSTVIGGVSNCFTCRQVVGEADELVKRTRADRTSFHYLQTVTSVSKSGCQE